MSNVAFGCRALKLTAAVHQFESIDYAIWAARNYGLRLIIPLTGAFEPEISSQRMLTSRCADEHNYCAPTSVRLALRR